MRYALFAGDIYYPAGGMNDLVGRFDNLDDAKQAGRTYSWWHIVDTQTFEVINQS